MTAQSQIDELARAFFASFDNRAGRRPDARALRGMFAPAARITRIAGDRVETMTAAEFVDPRVDLLSNGELTDFHEWEVEATTLILNDIATRASTYAKAGLAKGEAYGGSGRKIILLYREDQRWLISSLLWKDD